MPSSLKYWTIIKKDDQQKGGILFARTPTTINVLLLIRIFELLKTQWHDQENNFRKYTVNIFAGFYKLEMLVFGGVEWDIIKLFPRLGQS